MLPIQPGARGFTLLELVIAMTLAGLAALIGAAGLSAASDYYGRARQRLDAHEDLRALQRILRREWAGRATTGILARAGEVGFETTQPVFPGASPAGRSVRYRCLKGDDGRLALLHEAVLPPAAAGTGPARGEAKVLFSEILIGNLATCAFAFLQTPDPATLTGAGRRPPPTRWVPAPVAGMPPPRLLRLRLATPYGALPDIVVVAGEPG